MITVSRDEHGLPTHVLVPMDASLPRYDCWINRYSPSQHHPAAWVRLTLAVPLRHDPKAVVAFCDRDIPPIYDLDTRDLDYTMQELRNPPPAMWGWEA